MSLAQTKFVTDQILIFRWKVVVFLRIQGDFNDVTQSILQLNCTLNYLLKEQLKPTLCFPTRNIKVSRFLQKPPRR